mmetsp:Transcript_43256/g.136626  ORF Transcript_43256/g.136626 Transcript_43256/m.136626 type:complete len:615 (-) Transcript_43256:814-2658(-)
MSTSLFSLCRSCSRPRTFAISSLICRLAPAWHSCSSSSKASNCSCGTPANCGTAGVVATVAAEAAAASAAAAAASALIVRFSNSSRSRCKSWLMSACFFRSCSSCSFAAFNLSSSASSVNVEPLIAAFSLSRSASNLSIMPPIFLFLASSTSTWERRSSDWTMRPSLSAADWTMRPSLSAAAVSRSPRTSSRSRLSMSPCVLSSSTWPLRSAASRAPAAAWASASTSLACVSSPAELTCATSFASKSFRWPSNLVARSSRVFSRASAVSFSSSSCRCRCKTSMVSLDTSILAATISPAGVLGTLFGLLPVFCKGGLLCCSKTSWSTFSCKSRSRIAACSSSSFKAWTSSEVTPFMRWLGLPGMPGLWPMRSDPAQLDLGVIMNGMPFAFFCRTAFLADRTISRAFKRQGAASPVVARSGAEYCTVGAAATCAGDGAEASGAPKVGAMGAAARAAAALAPGGTAAGATTSIGGAAAGAAQGAGASPGSMCISGGGLRFDGLSTSSPAAGGATGGAGIAGGAAPGAARNCGGWNAGGSANCGGWNAGGSANCGGRNAGGSSCFACVCMGGSGACTLCHAGGALTAEGGSKPPPRCGKGWLPGVCGRAPGVCGLLIG